MQLHDLRDHGPGDGRRGPEFHPQSAVAEPHARRRGVGVYGCDMAHEAVHGGVDVGEDGEGGGFAGEDDVGGDDAVGPAFEGARGEGGAGGCGEEVGVGWGVGWWGERMMVVGEIECSESVARFRTIGNLVVVDWYCDGGNAECQEPCKKDKDNNFRRVRILHVDQLMWSHGAR